MNWIQTLSLSSNFKSLILGSRLKGLSLFVGDPPNTYSTIFTPKPPESLGLKYKNEWVCYMFIINSKNLKDDYLKIPALVWLESGPWVNDRLDVKIGSPWVDHVESLHTWCSALPCNCNGASEPVVPVGTFTSFEPLFSHNFLAADVVIWNKLKRKN